MAQSGSALEARQALEQTFPGVGVLERGEQIAAVFGRPMTRAATARAAMEDWMDLYQPVFGVDELEWAESRGAEISGGRIAYALRQHLTVEGGVLPEPTALPVEGGRLRALVGPEGEGFAVTYVASRAVDVDGGVAPPQITAEQAIAAAGEDERTRHLKVWNEPELVVVEMDLGVGPEVFAAWRLAGQESEEAVLSSLIVHVDAVTGEIVKFGPGVLHASDPVTGIVEGKATDGLGPPLTSTAITQALPDLIVSIVSETSTTTEHNGTYELETSSASVDVEASLGADFWTVYETEDDWTLSRPRIVESGVTPPASGVNFEFPDAAVTVEGVAVVNSYLNVQKSNGLFAVLPSWTSQILPTLPSLAVRPNDFTLGISCFALYNPFDVSLRFTPATSGLCSNSAYSTVVSHEYAHYIAHKVIEADTVHDGGFHEGYADSLAMLVHDTDIIGDGFWLDRTPAWFRRPSKEDITYPACAMRSAQLGPDNHTNGMLLGRLWWDIREQLDPDPLEEPENTRFLFAEWTMLTNGAAPPAGACPDPAPPSQPAGEGTLLEVLIADDLDGVLSNGTPNEAVICAAFASRNIFVNGNYGVCNESTGGGAGCRADVNHDRALDIFDFLEFENMFAAADMMADFTGDDELDIFDFLEFQSEFVAGCW